MSKRKGTPFFYDPEKTYGIADFEDTTIKNLYVIGKKLGVRDVKKPKKNELARLILSKHEEAKEKIVRSVLDGIINETVNQHEVSNTEELVPNTLACEGIPLLLDLMSQVVKEVPFYTIDSTQWFHANTISKYLQYKNYSSAIYKHVSGGNKISFHDIKTKLNISSYFMQFQPETIFINQIGVIELIRSSNLPKATGKPKRETEEVYVATTALYEKEQIYKIGKSYNSKKRIDNMNTGRIPSDEMYLCHIAECKDALRAESHIHTVLSNYRISNNREFFKADIHDIIKIVNSVCLLYC